MPKYDKLISLQRIFQWFRSSASSSINFVEYKELEISWLVKECFPVPRQILFHSFAKQSQGFPSIEQIGKISSGMGAGKAFLLWRVISKTGNRGVREKYKVCQQPFHLPWFVPPKNSLLRFNSSMGKCLNNGRVHIHDRIDAVLKEFCSQMEARLLENSPSLFLTYLLLWHVAISSCCSPLWLLCLGETKKMPVLCF